MFFDDYQIDTAPAILERWTSSILQRVQKEFPSVYYVSVSGSILTPRFNLGSDIDLLALIEGEEPDYNSIQLHCDLCEGRVLEVAVMPYFRLIQQFDLSPHTGNCVLLTEAYYSIPLLDKGGIRDIIIKRAGEVLQKGPYPLTTKINDLYRRRLFDAINNIKQAPRYLRWVGGKMAGILVDEMRVVR